MVMFPSLVCANGEMKEIEKITKEQVFEKERFEITFPEVTYTSDHFRDPFEAVVIEKEPEETKSANQQFSHSSEEVSLPALTVQGIIWGTASPQAIINDTVVRVGSTINGVTIEEITGSEIIVSYKNQKFSVPAPSGIKIHDIKSKGGR